MNKHTPGPWKFAQLEDNSVSPSSCADENVAGSIVGADGVYIARVWQDGDNPEADALVLAAAPDLLEALTRVLVNECPLTGNPSPQRLKEYWEGEKSQGRGEADDMLFALAAIAKATASNSGE